MAITQASTLNDSVVADFDNAYLLEAVRAPVWHDLVDFEGISESEGKSSKEFYALESLPVLTTTLPETTDISAQSLADSKITVDWAEYGGRIQLTFIARFASKPNVRADGARLIAKQMGESVDTVIRNAILGGTFTYMPTGAAVRTDLDTTADLISYQDLVDMVGLARSMGLVPFEGDTFAAPVHPFVLNAIAGLTEFKESAVYRNLTDPDKAKVFKHEAFMFAGIRFIPSRLGKLYLSGGTLAQATTIATTAAVAGDTTITVAADTGIAIGDWLTVGTLEAADAESVKVTAIAATPIIGILGAGNSASNRGLKYAHAIGAAVTEAANVAAIPLVGKGSIKGLYVDETGLHGQSVVRTDLDSLNRFVSIGWKWAGGVNIFPKLVLRGEFAIVNQLYGNQM